MTQNAPTSTAVVATDRPGRYGKQLVSHLTRRATGEWDEQAGTGWIQFPGGRVVLTATDGALALALSADDDADRLEDVVGRHLVRFGTRDELVVRWTRSDGTPGTVQENTEPNDTEQNDTEPNDTEPNDTEPNDTEGD